MSTLRMVLAFVLVSFLSPLTFAQEGKLSKETRILLDGIRMPSAEDAESENPNDPGNAPRKRDSFETPWEEAKTNALLHTIDAYLAAKEDAMRVEMETLMQRQAAGKRNDHYALQTRRMFFGFQALFLLYAIVFGAYHSYVGLTQEPDEFQKRDQTTPTRATDYPLIVGEALAAFACAIVLIMLSVQFFS